MRNKFFVLLGLSLSLVACTMGPRYSSPKIHPPAHWKAMPQGKSAALSNRKIRWWTSFHDPILNQLVDKLLCQNLDLKAAKARVLEARANRMNAVSALFPSVQADVIAGRIKPGFPTLNQAFTIYQGTLDASWELDLFGGNRSKVRAENRFIGGEIEATRDLTLSLIAELINNYLDVRMNQRQLRIVQHSIDASKTHLSLTQSLNKGGVTSELDVMEAQSQYQGFQADVSLKQIALTNAKNRLTSLLAMYPGTLDPLLMKQYAKIPKASEKLLLSMPAEVIRQRPDIRRAEHILAANTALIGTAIAKQYPNITIFGFYGYQSTSLPFPSTDIWGILPRLTLPILNFGRIRSQINLAKAREREAYFTYKQTVLNAFEDVENHLNAYFAIKQRAMHLVKSRHANDVALELAIKRYKKGISDFLNVTQSEMLLNQAQTNESIASTEQAKQLVALYKSLGVQRRTCAKTPCVK